MQANNFTPIVTFALLVAVSLAGCLGDGSSDASGADDPGAGGADGGNQTADDGNGTVPQDGGDGAQSPPLAKIHVSGENVTANGSSYVFAAGVSVTLDASNSTDPAGGDLAFAWDFGDDVTAEGAVVAMNFTAGNHTVRLTATSDASGQSSTARATLVATNATASLAPRSETIDGSITGMYAGAPVVGGTYATDPNVHTFDVEAGRSLITLTMDWDDTTWDLDFEVFAPDGTSAGSAYNYNEPTGQVFGAKEAPVVIDDPALVGQAGTWTVEVYSAGSIEGAYTLTVDLA